VRSGRFGPDLALALWQPDDVSRDWIIGTLLDLESSVRKVRAAVKAASLSRSCIPRVGELIENGCHFVNTPLRRIKLRDLHEASL
jgi:hypothetical protein